MNTDQKKKRKSKGSSIMSKKVRLNPLTDEPRLLTDLTRDYMLGYVKSLADEKEIKWFASVCKENIKEKTNQLNKEKVKTIDLPVVRRAFADRYFPNLIKPLSSKDFFAELGIN